MMSIQQRFRRSSFYCFLKPSPITLFILFSLILENFLLWSDRRAISLQRIHSLRIAFLWQFISDVSSLLCWHFLIVSCILKIGSGNWTVICASSVSISGGMLSTPADLPFFVCWRSCLVAFSEGYKRVLYAYVPTKLHLNLLY